jgi:AraC-like DNA-binding protein
MTKRRSHAKHDSTVVNGSPQGLAIRVVARTARVHPRVNRALKTIAERLGTSSDVSLKSLAAIAGLSPSRFMHVFTESVGVPLRPYILGLRLQRACLELMAGATVTSAALSAGFSDAAHFTRTSRRMLRMTPRNLLLHATRIIQIEPILIGPAGLNGAHKRPSDRILNRRRYRRAF